MNNPLDLWLLAGSFVGGVLLGLLFYGGLWWTVRRLAHAQQPALLMLGSFWLRTGVVVAGFYLLMNGSWQRLLLAGIGFWFGRQLVIRR